jgi:hypothetical protein
MSVLRRSPAGVAVSVAALASLWIAAPSEAAFTTPEFQSTFTGSGTHQIGNTRSVAVDQATNDIYVADRANHRIEKFDALGNFLFMFGDGVNQTTGGNICPVSPGDVCRPGQMSSATFPHWNSPSAVSVDNSNDASKGDVYVADTSEGTITKFDSGGNQITSNFGTNGVLQVYPFKMTVSAFTGNIWIIDQNWQIVSYDEKGTEGVRVNQNWNVGGEDDLAVDAVNDIYYGSTGGVPLKGNLKQESEFGGQVGITDPGQARGYYINPANGDILISFGEEVVVHDKTCNPALGYCAVKDSFGTGHLTDSRGLAVDSATGSVYVADSNGIEYFKPKVIPDITLTAQPAAGHTDATLFAHVDPLGAGNITECKVEWGPTKNYGNSVPCDQSLPITSAADVTAKLSGLTAESPYHYRFAVTNGNGTTKTSDLLVTPHWVRNLITGEADVNGPGEVTLHGSLDPNGEENHYFFEWGTTNAYGHKTPDAVGVDPGTTPGDTPVSVSLEGMVTSETTYHYRIVGYTPLGTSKGVDKTFTTPIAELPEIKDASVSNVGLETATIRGEVNPGFGGTSYMVQYGQGTGYDKRTVISPQVGDDGVFHPVSEQLEELLPGTTYHYRLVALNFRGTTPGPDGTFTTAASPAIEMASASVLSPRSARLTTLVTANGFSGNPTVHFEYGIDEGYGARSGESAPLGLDGGPVSMDVSGLAPSTTYHYRVVATDPFGTSVGPDQTFTTGPETAVPPPPGKTACRTGQVRRNGKCVKRRKRRKRHRHGARGQR